ncbi:hypothetical protein QFZ28_003185 [Neobacillus niacini]|uniref:hypothetical protein n=1 Tax=Neobacillus niacini TaxID=86668 RepID=UPI002784C655|nr:hypothetical protein [Neobacillus niacini]MDQ1002785.1 hypothetical protein [Neobacillus niacini]
MPILPEAINAAFETPGRERTIKEIKDWIYEKYGIDGGTLVQVWQIWYLFPKEEMNHHDPGRLSCNK